MKLNYPKSRSLLGISTGRLAILFLLVIPYALATALSSTIHLQHRFLPFPSTSNDKSAWSPLGSAAIDPEIEMTKLDTISTSSQDQGARDNGRGWYQVGVERDGEWVLASTRACLLSTPPSLVLHMTDSHLTSISIKTNTARCLNSTGNQSVEIPLLHTMRNIEIQRPINIASPSSSAPAPPADPVTGLPKQPIPEKSFLAKYWLPILGIALFAVGQLAAPGT